MSEQTPVERRLLGAIPLAEGDTMLDAERTYVTPTTREIEIRMGGTAIIIARDRDTQGVRLLLPHDGFDPNPPVLSVPFDPRHSDERIFLGPERQGQEVFPYAHRGILAEVIIRGNAPNRPPLLYITRISDDDVQAHVEPKFEDQVARLMNSDRHIKPGRRLTLSSTEDSAIAQAATGLSIGAQHGKGDHRLYQSDTIALTNYRDHRGDGRIHWYFHVPIPIGRDLFPGQYVPFFLGSHYQATKNPLFQRLGMDSKQARVVILPEGFSASGGQQFNRPYALITNYGQGTDVSQGPHASE